MCPMDSFTGRSLFACAVVALASGQYERTIVNGRDFCGLDAGKRSVVVNGIPMEVTVEYNFLPEVKVWVSFDLMNADEEWHFVDAHTEHATISLIDTDEEPSLRALHDLGQDLTVDTDLYIRMQQDNSVNPSAIYGLRTEDMEPVTYTFANHNAGSTILVIIDDKRHLQCQTESSNSWLCGSVILGLPETNQLTPDILFLGADFRPLDGTQRNDETMRSRYSWTLTYYRTKWKMADCGWLEPAPHAVCQCGMEPRFDIAVLLDYDSTTCISPFTSGKMTSDLLLKTHPQQPHDHQILVLMTNVACQEPYTLVATQNNVCEGDTCMDCPQLRQCALLSDVKHADDLNHCRFRCSDIGSCEAIFIRQHLAVWQSDNPETYVTCNVHLE